MENLHNKIIGERLIRVSCALRMKLPELADKLDVPYSTLYKNSTGATQASARLFVGLFDLGVDLHWLVSGKGEMFRERKGVGESPAPYHLEPNQTARKGAQICEWVFDYMKAHSPEECAWLEVEMSRHFPEYLAFKRGNEPK